MSLETALWEATRPAFRVRYIHDPDAVPRAPLYASFGIADAKSARAKLARVVRGAPEVVVKVTGRQKGGGHVKAHLDYIGRKGEIDIETRDGEILTSKEDIAERAEEWSDTLQWRSRATVSSVSMVFSMPEGTDPDKVLSAVRALAHAELSDNHDYVMALHNDTPRPHVHLSVQAEGLDRTRFNPRPVQLNRFRERFAEELRARGVAAEATRAVREARALQDRAWRSSSCGRASAARAVVRFPMPTGARMNRPLRSRVVSSHCPNSFRLGRGVGAKSAWLIGRLPMRSTPRAIVTIANWQAMCASSSTNTKS